MKRWQPSSFAQSIVLAALLLAEPGSAETLVPTLLEQESSPVLPGLARTVRKVEHFAAVISIDTGDEAVDGIIDGTMRTLIDRYEALYRAPKVDSLLGDEKEIQKLTRFYKAVLSRHEVVDIYILKHTNSEFSALQRVPRALRKRLRLIYNSGCKNERDAMTYLALGIEAFVGHRGISSSPVFNVPFAGCFAGNTKLLTIPLPFLTGESEPLKECVKRGNSAIQTLFTGDESTIWDGFASFISNLDTGETYTPKQIRDASYGHLYGSTETRVDEKRDIDEKNLIADFDLTEFLRKDDRQTAYLRKLADQNEIDYRFSSESEREKQLNADFQKFYRLFKLENTKAPKLSDDEKKLMKKNVYSGAVALSNYLLIDSIVSEIKNGQPQAPEKREFDDDDFKFRYFAGRLSTRMTPTEAVEWTELLFQSELTPERKKQIAWAAVQIERMREIYRTHPEYSPIVFDNENRAFPSLFSKSNYEWHSKYFY